MNLCHALRASISGVPARPAWKRPRGRPRHLDPDYYYYYKCHGLECSHHIVAGALYNCGTVEDDLRHANIGLRTA